MDLHGKTIVVTGGQGLLGGAMLEHIRAAGGIGISADIACADDLAKHQCHLDITDESSVRGAVDAIVKRFKRLDGWVNNAYPRSATFRLPFAQQPHGDFEQDLLSHLGGYALCARIVLEQMRTQRSGALVNMGSIYGCVAPDPRLYEGTESVASPAVYAAIKGGVLQLTRALAAAYGAYGVRVNAVSPGGIENPGRQPKDFIERYARRVPLGRMGTPEDVAPAVVFLLSDAARYVTGHNLLVDGGWTAI